RYTGDGLNFNASVSPAATLTVNQAAPTMTLLPAAGSSLRLVAGPNASSTLQATVSGPSGGVAPTGSILFLANGIAVGAPVPLVGGSASLTLSFPATGSSDITAQFLPDNPLYTPASATATVTASMLSLAAVNPTVVRGDTVNLRALETPVLSGATIEFVVFRGNQAFVIGTQTSTSSSLDPLRPGTIYNGNFRSDIPNSTLALGANLVYARYGSEPDRLKWAGPVTITVSPQGTTTSLSLVPPANPRYGDPVSIGATVLPDSQGTLASPQSGTVSVVDTLSGRTINSVTAQVFQLPQQNVFLDAGNYQFQAAYSGDSANFNGSKSAALPLTVGKALTSLTVTASTPLMNLGGSVSLTATLSANLFGSAGGTVQFMDNGVAIGAPRSLQAGVVTINHVPSRIGAHAFTAVYSGDGNFEGASGSALGTTVVTGRAPFFAVASGTGSGIQVFDAATRAPITTLFPETTNYMAGFRVATGDVTGDGVVDVVYSTTVGSTVGVIDGQSLAVLPGRRFSAFSPNYTRPVNLAVGDVNGDGVGDIAVAPGSTGTSPLVRAFSGADGSLLFSRLAYATNFTGGVSIAAGDLTGDGRAELICAPLTGNAARVVAFDVSTGIQVRNFTVAGAGSTNGFSIAAADLNGDNRADIVLGALAGSSRVTVVDGQTLRTLGSFSAFGNATTGARVAAIADFNNDGIADILVGAGANGNGQVRRYSGATRQLIDALFAFQSGSKERSSGVFPG
ncbi:MAG: Ig-like domain repeat protein, partial [Planctomycetes bacterium]|nr:Ig-like domain repeat protein [Planctomycetota bacterium]